MCRNVQFSIKRKDFRKKRLLVTSSSCMEEAGMFRLFAVCFHGRMARVTMDSLTFRPDLPCPTLLTPAGGPTLAVVLVTSEWLCGLAYCLDILV
jgi:hypothetical protein